MTPDRAGVAIVGGGLSGLALADGLLRAGVDFHLLEARDRVGGRVLSEPAGAGRFDLGPAWIWPHNRRALALAKRFGLAVHGQHAEGTLVFEDPQGQIRRDLTFATMGDALRLAGGMAGLTEALARALPSERVHLSHSVEAVETTRHTVNLEGRAPDGRRFSVRADRVVLALPPRLTAERMALSPAPSATVQNALAEVPTWMAGHAKVIAVYARPFWREAGLSGDAISHRGPLMEIHDATDEAAGLPALFGFAAPSSGARDASDLARIAVDHLIRLFGPRAADPLHVLTKNWLSDPATATARDAAVIRRHPAYGLPRSVIDWAGDRLLFAGTEVAAEDGGFLEGALEAAESALTHLLQNA